MCWLEAVVSIGDLGDRGEAISVRCHVTPIHDNGKEMSTISGHSSC